MKESHETLNPVKFVKDMFVRALAFKGLNLVVVGTGHVLVYRFDDSNGAYRVLPFGLGMNDSETGIVMSLAPWESGRDVILPGCCLVGTWSWDWCRTGGSRRD